MSKRTHGQLNTPENEPDEDTELFDAPSAPDSRLDTDDGYDDDDSHMDTNDDDNNSINPSHDSLSDADSNGNESKASDAESDASDAGINASDEDDENEDGNEDVEEGDGDELPTAKRTCTRKKDEPSVNRNASAEVEKPLPGWYRTKTVNDQGEEENARPLSHAKKYTDAWKFKDGIKHDLKPLSSLDAIFKDIVRGALSSGLQEMLELLDNQELHIATMCSGTEAPIVFLREFNDCLRELNHTRLLQFKHIFSAEIVDWKQHYILANVGRDVVLFKDITEFSKKSSDSSLPLHATTVWGSMVEVKKCDLLVAGFCCVDFSSLNAMKKTIADLGESGNTFLAIISYCTKCRPKMVLLENVASAPWTEREMEKAKAKGNKTKKHDVSIEKHFNDIGYAVFFVPVDTKNWYIPQTRVRGYMLCVRIDICDSLSDANARLAHWGQLMNSLKVDASAPIEDFLMKADDPLVRGAIIERSGGPRRKEIDWNKCAVGHEIYRKDLGLGTEKPMSNWRRNAAPRFPDFYLPLPERTDRLSDASDTVHLRNINRGLDDNFYSRNLDLSQNVYRDKDTRPAGIIGCFTPHGIPFNTTRGGKITGREGLLLQGLPVEKLQLEQLSNAQQHDLAGNAMSTTVVGPAMLCTFIAFGNRLVDPTRPRVVEPIVMPHLVGDDDLVEMSIDPAAVVHMRLQDILKSAMQSARLCYCEGRHETLTTIFQSCRDCHHTACVACGKKPTHNYIDMDSTILTTRETPAKFEADLKKILPMKMGFILTDLEGTKEVFFDEYKGKLGSGADVMEKAWEYYHSALTSDVHFTGVRRRENWMVYYHSAWSKVVLSITHNKAEWQLYAKVPEDLLGNDPIRLAFEQHPIARMTPLNEHILIGHWQSWDPNGQEFAGKIISKGAVVPSYQKSIGIKNPNGNFVHKVAEIRVGNREKFEEFFGPVCGEWLLHQSCGQAFSSLHKKSPKTLTDTTAADRFFYLEHTLQSGDPKEHGFIFTSDIRRLDYGERRTIQGRVQWRQPLVQATSLSRTSKVNFVVDGTWKNFVPFGIAGSDEKFFTFFHLPANPVFEPACNTHLTALKCTLALPGLTLPGPTNCWVEVTAANRKRFFKMTGWAFEKGKIVDDHALVRIKIEGMPEVVDLPDVNMWKLLRCRHGVVDCNVCAPDPPEKWWAYVKPKGNNLPRQVAFEDPETASNFERRMRLRPSGISIFYHYDNQNLEFIVAINPTTLCHQALKILKPSGKATTSWCLVTDDVVSIKAAHEKFELCSSKDEKPVGTPEGFTKNFALRPEQQKTLAWMLKQEEGVAFSERAFVEASSSDMGYLLMGQACQKRVVRGGILASEVGYGKTIMTIALALSCRQADEDFVENYTGSLIPTKATIVFCPNQLPQQWKDEAEKFMGYPKKGTVISVTSIAHLKNLTVAEVQNAKLIIVSFSVVAGEPYQLRLATLTGMVEPVNNATPRVKAAWHEAMRKQMDSAMECLKTNPSGFKEYLEDQLRINTEKASGTELPIPSKRLIGRAYQEANQKANNKRKRDELTGNALKKSVVQTIRHDAPKFINGCKTSHLVYVVFEMFAFARQVVDEFPYLIEDVLETIVNLTANSYWGLSGTPPTDTYAGIKAVATFLRVYVGPDDYFRMPKDVKEKAKKEMTSSEKVMTFNGASTAHMVKLRSEQARKFLACFVRKDYPNLPGKIEVQSHLRPVLLPISEAIAYLEYEMECLAIEFDVKAHRTSTRDSAVQVADVLAKFLTPREALLVRASRYVVNINALPNITAALKNSEPSSRYIADVIKQFRHTQRFDERKELQKKIVLADHLANLLGDGPLENEAHDFAHAVHRWENNRYGDLSIAQVLTGMFNYAHEKYDENIEQHLPRDRPCLNQKYLQDGMELIKKEIQHAIVELVQRERSFRLWESFLHVLDGQVQCEVCGKSTLNSSAQLEDFELLTSCGHVLCRTCLDERNECRVNGCTGCHGPNTSVKADTVLGEQKVPYFHCGEKLRQIVALIKSLPANDQVLVFVQTELLHSTAKEAFKLSEISFTELKNSTYASKQLTTFQLGKGTKAKPRLKVLLLDANDATAAGSNLTNANHIIFLTPYFTLGTSAQTRYDAAMRQAKGRVDRLGQTKKVHFYHFLTLRTIDVDTYEHREKKVLIRHGNEIIWVEISTGHAFDLDGKMQYDDQGVPLVFTRSVGDFRSRIGIKVFDVEGAGDEF